MQDTKRRKLNPYQSKYKIGDIVRNVNGGCEYIVVKKDRKNNPVMTLIRRYRPWTNFYPYFLNISDCVLSSQTWRDNIKKGDSISCDFEGINMTCVVISRDEDLITIQPIGVRVVDSINIHSDRISHSNFQRNGENYEVFDSNKPWDHPMMHSNVSINIGGLWRAGIVLDSREDMLYVKPNYNDSGEWVKACDVKMEFQCVDSIYSEFEECGSYTKTITKPEYASIIKRMDEQGCLTVCMRNDTFREYCGISSYVLSSLLCMEHNPAKWVNYDDYTKHLSIHNILETFLRTGISRLSVFVHLTNSHIRKIMRLEATLRSKKLIKTKYTLVDGDKIKVSIWRPKNYKRRWLFWENAVHHKIIPSMLMISPFPEYPSGSLEDLTAQRGTCALPSNIMILNKCQTKIPLLPFQEQVVDLMIKKENKSWDDVFKWSTHMGKDYNIISGITCESNEESGGILGLKVGFGKTICTLGLVTKAGGSTLIVCKLSLIDQWIKEAHRFTNLTIGEVHGRKKKLVDNPNIVFTTYGTLVSQYRRGGCLRRPWDRVVFDESHTLKSAGTTVDACVSVNAYRRWCLSATPFVNGIFKNILFQLRILRVMGFSGNQMINSVTYDPHTTQNKMITTRIIDLIIRPRVDNIINVQVEWHTIGYNLSIPTLGLYNALFKVTLKKLQDLMNGYQFTKSYQKIKSYVNTLLICCNSPSLVPLYWWGELLNGESSSVNLNELNATLTEEESNFSKQVQKDLAKLNELTCCLCLEPLTRPTITKCNHMYCHDCIKMSLQYKNKCPQCRQIIKEEDLREIVNEPEKEEEDSEFINIKDPLGRKVRISKHIKKLYEQKEESPKIKILKDIMEDRKQVVVFSQFNSVLEYFHRQIGGSIITGRTTRNKRDKQMTEFSEGKTDIFFLSTKVADVGINLTSADTVVFLEPGIETTVQKQCIGRVKRIGQENNIKIYKLVTHDAIEGKVKDAMSDYNVSVRHIMNSGFTSATQSKKKKYAYLRCMIKLFKL